MDVLLDELTAVTGARHVLSGDAVRERASHLWNPEPLAARALVRPRCTEEVSRILACCHRHGQSVVTQGGRTGLAGGESSTSADIVLSLERMCRIEEVNSAERTLSLQAGCTLQDVQRAAAGSDLQFGLDIGARGSCTIGGNIATNAGGLSVLRYGMMREQVLGLEVVLADGTVLDAMNTLIKNNTGYDLKQLFVGSEGTLGVITRAVLRLRAATTSRQTALLACERFDQVIASLTHMNRELNGQLHAFEVIWQPFYRLNTSAGREGAVSPPLSQDHAVYAIVESRGSDPAYDAALFERAITEAFEYGQFVDAVVAQSEKERSTLWAIRENVSNPGRGHNVFTYDISLPIQRMDAYITELRERLEARWPNCVFFSYGHIADGNLHLQIDTGLPAHDNHAIDKAHSDINDMVYLPLQAVRGSISAEHGIGTQKKRYLPLSRQPVEIALMRSLKQWLDPAGILNPGKIV